MGKHSLVHLRYNATADDRGPSGEASVRIGITFNVKVGNARRSPTPAWSDASAYVNDEEEEFDSPETIMALHSVLQDLGHEVQLLGDGEELLRHFSRGPRPDLVLNIAEGRGSSRSREARVPAVLEMLGIPYTGTDPLTLAVTLDKDCAKRLVRDAGVATPAWVLVDRELTTELEQRLDHLCVAGVRQAGLRRLEQGHSRQQPGPRPGRTACLASPGCSMSIASRFWSRSSSTATS